MGHFPPRQGTIFSYPQGLQWRKMIHGFPHCSRITGGGRRRKRAIYDVERIQTQETGSTVDLVTFFHHFQLPMNSFGSLPLTAFLAFSHSSFPCHPPPPPVLPSLLPNRSLLSSSSPLPLQLVIMNHMVNPHSYFND